MKLEKLKQIIKSNPLPWIISVVLTIVVSPFHSSDLTLLIGLCGGVLITQLLDKENE